MRDFISTRKLGIALLILISAMFFHFGLSKSGFYIDEIYTYGLSNSTKGPYLSDVAGGDLIDKTLTHQDLVSYVTVDKGEGFDYAPVYTNQEKDVHPPLYYFLFHTVSSLTPGVFSKWTGLGLNFVLFLLALWLLAKICEEMEFQEDRKYWAWVLYGLSTGGMSTAIYIRMYELMTVLTLLLVFLVLRLLHTKEKKYCLLSFAAIFLGMLTQYYFAVYACFLCLAVCIALLKERRFGLTALFAFCALAGVAAMVAVFPASLCHIFVGNGQVVSGSVAVNNLLDVSQWLDRLLQYGHYVTHGIKVACIAGILVLGYLLIDKRLKFSKDIILLTIPAVLCWLVIALIAAVKEERYIYNLLPIFVLFVVYLLSLLELEPVPLICVAVIAFTMVECNSDYLQLRMEQVEETLSPHTADRCVYMTDNEFAAMTSDFEELYMFDSVFTAKDPASKALGDYVGDSGELVVFVDSNEEWSSGLNPEKTMQDLKKALGKDSYEPLLKNSLSDVYLVR